MAEADHRGPNAGAVDDMYFSARDGLKLHARDYGRAMHSTGVRAPLICLPGLTRNHRDFHRFALYMSGIGDDGAAASDARRVVSFDYRGRGGSERDENPANYTIAVEAEDVLTGMAALGLEHAVFVGTSRGALIVHALAAVRPGVIAGAVLNDAGPVIEGAGLAQIKSYLTRMPTPKDRQHAAEILREAHGASFPALEKRDWAEMAEAIYREEKGRPVADYDPALARQMAQMDFSTPLPTLWPQFDGLKHCPVMVIRGANSQLLAEKTVEQMIARRAGITVETVPEQGHAPILHLAGLPKKIEAFLSANGL